MRSSAHQCGLICGAIEESSRSLKAIDECVFTNFRDKNAVFTNFHGKNAVLTNFRDKNAVFTNFRDKNAVFTSFRDKNYIFDLLDRNTLFGFNFVCSGKDQSIDSQSVLLIGNLFYR